MQPDMKANFVRAFETAACLILLMPALSSCEREKRDFHAAAPTALASENVPWGNANRPGPPSTTTPSTNAPVRLALLRNEPFGQQMPKNAQALSDGQTLYESFNCVGCHAHGGGGMAPPLVDNKWFYGGEPDQVYTSIIEGRPNGMPSFRGRIPDYQTWEIVAYVRSMNGQASKQAAGGREDHMTAQPPPNSMPYQAPVMQQPPTTGPVGGGATGQTTMPATTRAATTTGAK